MAVRNASAWRGFARRFGAVVGLFTLGGCVAAIPSVEVTRFHPDAVPASGAILVQPANARDEASLEFRTSANAVAAALGRVGFTVREAAGPAVPYVALVEVTRVTQAPVVEKRSPVSVGVGGSAGSYGSGLGVGIGINLSGPPKPIVTTQLRVQIRRAADGQAVWEGRAETAAKEGSPAAQPGLAAGKLATALFQDFPGKSGVTITVK
jgi:hypothetical protein